MFALCIESSHARGMGHFYRALNLIESMREAGLDCTMYLNDHLPSLGILQKNNIDYRVVPLHEKNAKNWERDVIRQDHVSVWINDRLDTDVDHCQRVTSCDIPLVTFDDRGSGASLADLNIVALAFDENEQLMGKRVVRGIDYLVLNPEILLYRRVRNRVERILVTMGGADTYGVTVKVAKELYDAGRKADIIVGPSFEHKNELKKISGKKFRIKQGVPSLIAEFEKYDLAITGGGITPFEANASGLPCIIIANELFEIPIGNALAQYGSSGFAGYHENMDNSLLSRQLNVEKMSQAGLEKISLHGMRNVIDELKSL
ncbi:Glycosyl transferase family 28 C-terminal domain-containing protein [Candidatus Electrothrix gigas]